MGLPTYTQPVVLVMLLLFGGYLLYEVVRWRKGNKADLTRGQFRRRMAGGVLLMLDLLMWYAANPLFANAPHNPRTTAWRLLYLLTATLFVLLPMLLAVREAAFVMRQYAQWKGDLLRNMARGETGERRSE